MTEPTPECITINPTGKATATIIWLHGLGADGSDFEPVAEALQLPDDLALRFVFPHAPIRPVTINGGMEMRAWYDVDPDAGFDSGAADIRAAAESIEALVAQQNDLGVPTRRIVLAGFSQGGVIALHTGLRHRQPLAGIMALSTYLHDHQHFTAECSFENADTSILYCHGVMDPMIPVTRAITSREALLQAGYQVEWHEYGMAHAVCPEELIDIRQWLLARFA